MESEQFYMELSERGLTISDLTEWEWSWVEGLLDHHVRRLRETYPSYDRPMMLLADRLWELRNKVRGRGDKAIHTLRGEPLPEPPGFQNG